MWRDRIAESSSRPAAIGPADIAIVGLLAVLAGVLRLDPLAPSSLWIDDAWAALVVKAHGAHDVLLAGVTAPGFAILLKGWLAAAGFSELNAQLLPFVAGVLTAPFLFLVARWMGVGRLGATIGALALAGSVVHMTYSTRVKQYTLDGLVALAVLALAWWLVRDVGNRRRWWLFAVGSVVAIVLSSPAIAVVTSSLVVAVAVLVRARKSRRAALPPVVVIVGFIGAWWWLMLRPRVNGALKEYWSGYFIPRDEGVGRALFIAARDAKDVFAGAVPPNVTSATVAALSVPVAVAVLLLARRYVAALLFVVAPMGLAVALAAVDGVPLGTGRTDIYLYPGIALAIAMAVHELEQRWRRATVAAVCLVLVAQVIVFKPVLPYPARDVGPLVAELEQRAAGTDGVLVRPDDDFAFALYTTWPVTFREANAVTGFAVAIERPNVHVPLLVPNGSDGRTETWPEAIARTRADSERVWFLTGGQDPIPKPPAIREPYVHPLLQRAGLRLQLEVTRPGGSLTLWSTRRR
jgi:hypothetical protein